MTEELNPGHLRTRAFLRRLGPIVLVCGLAMIAVAFISFFSSFASGGTPRYFWCGFVGIPLSFVGMVLSSMGYAGAIARYQAAEVAPIGNDVVNYLADGTKDGVKTMATAVAAGLREGASVAEQNCSRCGHGNDRAATFCDECGTRLIQVCKSCNESNDGDAKYCDNCGSQLS